MTQEQIETKALEEYPNMYGRLLLEGDVHEEHRAAFIKGCQYAATPERLTVEGQQPFERYPELTESILWFAHNVGVPLSQWTNHLQRINEAITEAGTPSVVSREDAEKWAQQNFPIEVEPVYNKVGEHINNMDLNQVAREAIYQFYDYVASLSPAQPGYSEQQVRDIVSRLLHDNDVIQVILDSNERFSHPNRTHEVTEKCLNDIFDSLNLKP